MKTISIRPPNSLILIMDFVSGVGPNELGKNRIAATDSCIAIGCRAAPDGPTEISLIEHNELIPTDPLVFECELQTPNKKLSICSVWNEELLFTELEGTRTSIKIFANHSLEPDRIYVMYTNLSKNVTNRQSI